MCLELSGRKKVGKIGPKPGILSGVAAPELAPVDPILNLETESVSTNSKPGQLAPIYLLYSGVKSGVSCHQSYSTAGFLTSTFKAPALQRNNCPTE